MAAGSRVGGDQRLEEIEVARIIAAEFLSVDGVMGAPETWHMPYFNDEMGEVMSAQMAEAGAMLLGRRTYEEFAASWPARTAADFGPLADYMNNTPKLVVSTTLETVEWHNSTLIKGDVAEEIGRLKQQPGKTISVLGSATLVRSLLRDHLLDELRLLVDPIVVGTGKRLFEDSGDRVGLKLVGSRTFRTGVLSLTYLPAAA
jgi:dihydrofolate reductase